LSIITKCLLYSIATTTFARASAAIGMKVEDYYVQDRGSWVRLHEKSGKQHDMPAHHLLDILPYSAPQPAKLANSPTGA
jgi:hypothetical protein